ncbi:unnamed protein product [Lymnaea stagnalis]|uniref:Uncharacterized protein n=1 Tax=Lymnaea stagnalis TaxID=6523 RepID=A0AAV2HR83_LYMST
MMALPGGLSGAFYLGLVLLGLGTVLHVIGLATPEWSVEKHGTRTQGLFKGCFLGSCGEYTYKTSKLEACEAFAIIGMVAGIGATAVSLLIFLLGLLSKNRHRIFSLLVLAGSVVAFIAILICVIIYGVTIHDDISYFFNVGYSFILSIIGGALIPIGGFFVYSASK